MVEIKKKWYKRWYMIVIYCFMGLIILGAFSPKTENNNPVNNPTTDENSKKNFPEIGYLSLVESDGTCEVGTIPIILWKNPELTIVKDSIKVEDYEEFCSGGIRVLIEDVQDNKVKILISDRRFDNDPNFNLKNGWLLRDLVKANW